MNFLDKLKDLFQKPAQSADAQNSEKEGSTFYHICQWIYKLRSVFLAIPVVFGAVVLAIYSAANLPDKVSIYFPSSAEKELLIKLVEMDKGTAIFVPLLITTFCLLMMFCSRRVIYPWLISIFSLVLPLFMLFISAFPG